MLDQFCILSTSLCGCEKETYEGYNFFWGGGDTYAPPAVILYSFVHFYKFLSATEIYLMLLSACNLFKSIIIKISTLCLESLLKMSFCLAIKLLAEKR